MVMKNKLCSVHFVIFTIIIFHYSFVAARASVNGFTTSLFRRFAKKRKPYKGLSMVHRGGQSASRSSSPNTNLNGPIFPEDSNIKSGSNMPVNLLFSDVDGTLVHYPASDMPGCNENIIHLPPSSTGMRGIISSKTLKLCQTLRHEQNTRVALVSGMRTSTLLKRLPYLPKADAYASEAGGRIFYPVNDLNGYKGTIIEPVHFHGATEEDLLPFGLVEDLEWRKEMSKESAAGTDGYLGNSFDIFLNLINSDEKVKEVNDRNGSLWKYAQSLQNEGFALDVKGYSCCFRVNIKQQRAVSEEQFSRLSTRDVTQLGLATSVNLGCVDFYPKMSGKRNCCLYLAKKFLGSLHVHLTPDDVLLQQAICLCDDDNDLEMASACGTVFLPSVSSQSMADAARQNPNKIFITENETADIIGTVATEQALIEALGLIQSRGRLRP